MKQVKHRSAKTGPYITAEAVEANRDGTITEIDSTLTPLERAVVKAAKVVVATMHLSDPIKKDAAYKSLMDTVHTLNEAEQDQR